MSYIRRLGFIRYISLIQHMGLSIALIASTGCAVEPWVKPYERDKIADPIMSFEPDPIVSSYTDHVYQAREGARGAEGSGGGGCGCN